MSFYANSLIFDGIPSEIYGLYIGSSGDGGESSNSTSGNVTPSVEKIYRRPKNYLYGVNQEPVLTFEITLFSYDEITAPRYEEISKWLFGQMNYKKLQICQPDMTNIYFNCFLIDPQIIRTGNVITGVSFKVECDAPWGWGFPESIGYNYSGYMYNDTIEFNNESGNNDYLYPTLDFVVNSFGGSISITNTSDSNRIFLMTGLSANEAISFDCDHQIITSDTSDYRLGTFNKNWVRLVPGLNTLIISANVASIIINYQLAYKIGG